MTTLGERLAEAMKRAGYSQARLGDRLGVRQGTVSEWVTGKYLPAGDALTRLPALLGVDGHWLLTGEGASAAPAPALEPSTPSDYLHTRMALVDGQGTLTEWQRVLARDVEVAAILADAIREAERAATIRAGALRAAEDAAGERARAATAAEEAAVLRARSVAEEAADRRLREAYVPLPKEGDETQQKKRKTG